ncbi:agmatinase family protein [Solihabitans fulvus]|uniref:Agmatinase family protein n=1 Tax=Solihabitans fulvus TaxID=1892852 RepID=A0A5B2XBQ0_9PSEU|nr:agmatinase family protein [Solihabitans fulvus]KAA2260461.1 agmatinase family protein [Solihabitans fulvus]
MTGDRRADRGLTHLRPPGLVVRSGFEDRYETEAADWLLPWDFDSPLDVGIVGAGLPGTSLTPNGAYGAPDAFRSSLAGFSTYSPDFDVDLAELVVRDLGDIATPTLDPLEGLRRIDETTGVLRCQPENFFLMMIGGDHSVTAPAAKAFARAHPGERFGLIHFDAHNDVRVMDHGPTNGTPIRQLLESGLGFDGANLVQIGIHGFMNASYYKRWVQGRGGTIFTGREVRRRSIEDVLAEALERACDGVDATYVTVDVDVLESAYAPGTGAATAEGIHPMDLYEALYLLGQHPKVAGIDFVEHDPVSDVAALTGRTMTSAVLTFLCGYFLRTKGSGGWRGYDPTPVTEF